MKCCYLLSYGVYKNGCYKSRPSRSSRLLSNLSDKMDKRRSQDLFYIQKNIQSVQKMKVIQIYVDKITNRISSMIKRGIWLKLVTPEAQIFLASSEVNITKDTFRENDSRLEVVDVARTSLILKIVAIKEIHEFWIPLHQINQSNKISKQSLILICNM